MLDEFPKEYQTMQKTNLFMKIKLPFCAAESMNYVELIN